MQMKLGENVLVAGTAGKDAELRQVGEKNTPVCKFSLAVDKREDKTVWAECEAWQRLSGYAANIRKGDAVLALGKVQSHEYNGKTYHTLRCEFVCNPAAFGMAAIEKSAGGAAQEAAGGFVDITGEGEELPF